MNDIKDIGHIFTGANRDVCERSGVWATECKHPACNGRAKPPTPSHPIERLTVHTTPPRRSCHVHVYGPNIFMKRWTVRCDCGRVPGVFSKNAVSFRNEKDAVQAGRDHLAHARWWDE